MMKHFVFVILATLIFYTGCSQNNSAIMDKPKVDERVELLSIVARLAEYQEYNNKNFKLYTDRIEKHFSPYKDHEVVQFAKKIRIERGIGYDAVMAMAVYVDEKFDARTEFTDTIPEQRWGKENAEEFVRLLKDFYKKAKCKEFFEENKDLYKEASNRFSPIFEYIDLDWYSAFYGEKPSEKYIIINGLGNGHSNYGPSYKVPNRQKEVYAIMGAWSTDSLGMVVFNADNDFPILLHEFNHSFVNHLLEKNESLFKDSGEKIFDQVKNEMSKQAYGNWKTVLNEALVRAAVIKYMKDHKFNSNMIENEINGQLNRSFLWIKELVQELDNYDKQRDTYPTLESYMPKLAEAYRSYPEMIRKMEESRPKVVSIKEFNNGDTNISSALNKITINFDIPLLAKGYSIYYGSKGQNVYPKFGKIVYSEDKKSVILEVELEKNKEYQFVLGGKEFKSPEGMGIKDYEVSFKTAE